jgi:molybdenum-dependent DNA-binding transcriptional regulator ModE
MNKDPWRARFRREDELVEQLQTQLLEAAERRGAALVEGLDELGTVYRVAKDVGKSYTAVSNAIKKYGPQGPTTE